MVASGMRVADDIKPMFEDMKMNKTYKAILCGTQDDKSIEVLKTLPPDNSRTEEEHWDALVAELQELQRDGRGCYAVYDFGYTKKNSLSTAQKLIFICWAPDENCPVKQKMLLSSSKDSVVKAMDGIHLKIEASDMSDLEREGIIKDLHKSDK